MPPLGDFDVAALFDAVDEQRAARDMTWANLTREIAWMSRDTIERMRATGNAGCHHILPLIQWLGRTPESFTVGGNEFPGELLPDPGAGEWRWYWNMPELASALDAQRDERGMKLADLADALATAPDEIKHLTRTRYGTSITIAMRAARWLDRTATSFMWEHDGRGLPWSGRRL